MTGKGFIEPHRNNLPRRKRKVLTTAKDGAAAITLEIDKTAVSQILLSEAGPCSSTGELNPHDVTSPANTDLRLDLRPRPCVCLQSKRKSTDPSRGCSGSTIT
jgi:hypothetical protein